MNSETPVEARQRTISTSLAPLLATLEADRSHLLTIDRLQALCDTHGVKTPAKVVAFRLRNSGWLLPTGQSGVYEFCPAERGAALTRADMTLPLQALLTRRPNVRAAVTLHSAAWIHGFADRIPTILEVAMHSPKPRRTLRKADASDIRFSTFTPRLAPMQLRGAPVLAPESILMHMAHSPRDVRSWSSAFEWLPELAAAVKLDLVEAELTNRRVADTVRLGYLMQSLRPDIAERCVRHVDGRVDFGTRRAGHRYDATWHVRDTALPANPQTLATVTT